jgi:hypothetical protein
MEQAANIVIKARDEASAKFRAVGGSANQLGRMLGGIAAVAAGYLSARAIVNFGVSSVKAFSEAQAATQRLKDSLAMVGPEAVGGLKGLEDFAAQMQRLTTEEDDALKGVMSLGASMGGLSGDQLKAATVAAIGFSRSLGVDTETAMKMVSKAAQGSTGAFGRYGIVLDDSMSAQEKFAEIIRRGSEGFAIAQGETQTYGGAVAQLKNTWGDLKESIGGAITGYLPGLTKAFKFAQVVMENWGLSSRIVWEYIKLGAISAWEDFKHLFAVQIPELFQWFLRNWKDVFITLWNFTSSVFVNMAKNIAEFFKATWSWLKGEGFDFTWTSLLDGFESTLKELPVIAKRELTDTEKTIAAEINKLQGQFQEKLDLKLNPPEFKAEEFVAKVDFTGLGGKIKASTKDLKLEASESRFLTFAPGQKFDKVERNTAQSNKLLESNNKLLAAIKGGIDRIQVGRYELEGFGLT